MQGLAEKYVVVLGAGRGLGALIAERAAAEGARTLAVRRNGHSMQQPIPAGFELLTLDAADEAAPDKVFAALEPSLLIICGGARPHMAPIHEMSWDQFSGNWENDVKMSFGFCKAALDKPLAPGSVVILISSGAALGGSPISGGYAGAKRTQMFVANYCQKESDRLGLGIRFIALAPAMIMAETEFGTQAVEAYAKYLGMSAVDFVQGMVSPQTAENVVDAIFEIAGDPDAHAGSLFKVSSDGISSIQ